MHQERRDQEQRKRDEEGESDKVVLVGKDTVYGYRGGCDSFSHEQDSGVHHDDLRE